MAVTCRWFLCVLASCILTGASSNTTGFLAPSATNVAKNGTSDVPNTAFGSSKFGGDRCYDNCLLSFHDCNKDPTAFAECSGTLNSCYSNCR
eukprot:Skav220946  [mRNA]  locus=scaffold2381:140449:140724:- [translate_table: standard]